MNAPEFTEKQGQYLAFIHTYRLLHREAPSQVEIADFFGVQPASVVSMLNRLADKGLLVRQAGVARSLQVTVPAEVLPPLVDPLADKPTAPAAERDAGPARADLGPITQCRIDLVGAHPPIWRRVLFPAEISMYGLHLIIQAAMGWENYHLHEFEARGEVIGPIDPDDFWSAITVDEDTAFVNDYLYRPGDKIKYTYDFGDGWEHTVKLEKILAPDPNLDYPVCIKGRRACPPEDVGGIYGYAYSMEALADPDNEEHQSYVEWYGGAWDPEAFSVEEVNQRLAALSPESLAGTQSLDELGVHPLTMIRTMMLSEDHGAGLYTVTAEVQGTPPDPNITESITQSQTPQALLALLPQLEPAHLGAWLGKAATFGREMGDAIIAMLGDSGQAGDPTWQSRAHVPYLALMDFAPDILPRLMDIFDQLDDYERSLVCMLLGRFGVDAYVPAILGHLDAMAQDRPSGLFLGPLWALVDLERPEAADILYELLEGGEYYEEMWAMLSRMGDMRVVPILLTILARYPEQGSVAAAAMGCIVHRVGRHAAREGLTSLEAIVLADGREIGAEALVDLLLSQPVEDYELYFHSYFYGPSADELAALAGGFAEGDALYEDEEDDIPLFGPYDPTWPDVLDPFDELEEDRPRQRPRVLPGPNDPCWCGSGRKYRDCHRQEDLGDTG